MSVTPVCATFDHLGRGKDVGLGTWIRPAADGPEIAVGIPRVMRVLEEHGVTGTFYVEGWSALHHADVVRDLVGAGHDVGLHGWVHERWTELARDDQERILRDGWAALRNAGATRIGFRAPHGIIDAGSFELLAEIGFHHDSSRLETFTGGLQPRLHHGVPHLPFSWDLVDYWVLRKADERIEPSELAACWMKAALACHARNEPVVVDIHPFFAALDDEIWDSICAWMGMIADDPRFGWSTIPALADEVERGVVPDPERPDAAWQGYLRTRGHEVADDCPAVPLTGGVSASVIAVGKHVVKRPLGQLSVPMEWLASTDRVLAEATALRRASDFAPKVLDVDPEEHVIVMERVEATTWKDQLMGGEIRVETAATVGRLAAEVHALDPAGLYDPERFDELRLDPYLRTAALNVPRYSDELHEIADRLRTRGRHLVHGDYSPKNMLVDGDRVTILDWEVAHAGDPMFDVAFLLTHLMCKATVMPEHRDTLGECAARFLDAYAAGPDSIIDEQWASRIVGALILGRTDGLSPLPYLDDGHRDVLRKIAGELIENGGPLWQL